VGGWGEGGGGEGSGDVSTNMGNLEKLGILVIVILVVVVGVVAITPKATVDERLMPEMAAGETAQEPEVLEPATPPVPGDPTKPVDPWPTADGKQTELKPLAGGPAPVDPTAKAVADLAPPAPSFRTVKILKGDTPAKIAKRELGSATRYQEILDANPGLVATKLVAGKDIRIPTGTAKAAEMPVDPAKSAALPLPGTPTPGTPGTNVPSTPTASERVYVVKKGDTLSSIASREMGSANKWRELLAANEDVLHGSTALKLNTKLRIPASAKSTSTLADPAPAPAGGALAAPSAPTDTPSAPSAPAAGEREYVVKSGDSLWLIAKNEMGSEKLVGALRAANAGILGGSDNLKVGTTLRIPATK
jgi:nucleoid-associated protein YgaU